MEVIMTSASNRSVNPETGPERVAAAADAELKNALDSQTTRTARRVQDVPMPLVTAVSAWAA